MRYIMDLARHFRVWPHARFNAQTGANFYQLAYSADGRSQDTSRAIPTYRTDDRELSPLVIAHRAAAARASASALRRRRRNTASRSRGTSCTRSYFDALFITLRTAVYGSLGFDAEFD